MTSSEIGQVRKRRVFYIPGYDPIHPRRYRELYRKEGAEQARISGYEIALAPKRAGGPYGWHVTSTQGGTEVEADIEVLVWSDIVRSSMGKSIPATYGQLIRTASTYIFSGALFRLMRLRKGPVIAALYPIVALIVQALIGIALGWAAAALALRLLPDFPLKWLAGLTLASAILALVLRWFRAKDGRFFAYYLMHDYAFTARWGGANPPELETRIGEFATRIAEALQEDWDEVLIVGHSSGAHLAISILADLIRDNRLPPSSWNKYPGGRASARGAEPPALSFLSLGQVVPMVSYLPRATRLRADLAFLSTRPELFWLDVTAPGDGCAFALCDPVAVSGVAPEGQIHPLVISAAFTQTLSPERWKALRWRFFQLHFQYLCAFDRPGDYDYFRLTAGPMTLARRFTGRPASKSRITTPANRFTTTS
ncbi:hypothetical protein BMI90_07950 [Thioclava sp. L04-15]|uniref:hypothetical protein n=1 Tax=Thioclava sp. L04-15 TaxID=1915318 RepID=UPI0009979628|nr:hypothetical protein [Thioclava sp. L04-15]OOY28584.1 hypothetical protein BMI90_07950 [Thioclava sp. L04-15]TNE91035.1 MAG: hypothetical protein EP337_06880 [Paracoccaceae bacterium]